MVHKRTDSARRMHILMGPRTPDLSDSHCALKEFGPDALPTPPLSPRFSATAFVPLQQPLLEPQSSQGAPPEDEEKPVQITISLPPTSTRTRTSPLRVLETIGSALNPRKKRFKFAAHRTTFLALLLLATLSVYLFLVAQPRLSVSRLAKVSSKADVRLAVTPGLDGGKKSKAAASKQQKHRPKQSNRPQLEFSDASEELAAVTSFIVSLRENVIPSFVDPSKPIDPELVLDFDTRGGRAREELESIVSDVWARFPVILFSKLYHPSSREVKAMISSMNLRPEPTIIDVDQRPDADTLIPLLYRLTSPNSQSQSQSDSDNSDSDPETEVTEKERSLPILLLGGHPIASYEDIKELNERGELRRMVREAGAVVGGGRRKGKGRR